MTDVLLASSSRYRRALLERLQIPFSWASPDIDESPLPNEKAHPLVTRLAEQKARALSQTFTNHLIIGSDQAAVLADGSILGKPGTFEQARRQLRAASASSVTFLTGIAVLNSHTDRLQVDCIPFTVHFRQLSDQQIERYLLKESPLDCAGSFKAEALGVTLFQRTEGEDATSLIGLPLIRLTDMLLNEGLELP